MHGFALAPDLGRGFTSNGRANTSTIVDLKTLKPLGTVMTGANPDSIRYSPSRKEVWAFNHTGKSVTVFDAQTGKVIATINVGGDLEEAVEDAAANRMFVNVEDKGAIGVMDTVKHTLVATWPIAECEGPTGLAFDAKNHLLLSACDGKMAVTDSTSGKAVTSFPIPDGVDGNGFDPATGYAFASSGTGVLTIAHEDAPNKFTVVQTVKTQPSGRTMWLDAATHNVYVPVATTTPGPNGRAQITPNTMKVLVFGMGAAKTPGGWISFLNLEFFFSPALFTFLLFFSSSSAAFWGRSRAAARFSCGGLPAGSRTPDGRARRNRSPCGAR